MKFFTIVAGGLISATLIGAAPASAQTPFGPFLGGYGYGYGAPAPYGYGYGYPAYSQPYYSGRSVYRNRAYRRYLRSNDNPYM